MVDHIEWVQAADRPIGYTAADLAELDEDGNQNKHIGLRLGSSDGAMLYGQRKDILTWLERAVNEVSRIINIEKAERLAEVTVTVQGALSRDDQYGEFSDGGVRSEFDDKVQIIRSLNEDSLWGPHNENPSEPNHEYRRGQVELLMDTTAWIDTHPEKEDVYLYIFNEEMA